MSKSSNNSSFTLGISPTKPHQLLPGELDWWLGVHTTYIKTQDFQCWRVIELGDEEIPESVKVKYDWKPEHYAIMDKNSKAHQLILCGLTRTDIDKVINIKMAKEMWAAIITIHRGSEDMRGHRKFILLREFHAFKMLLGESVSDCQSRFTILVDKLSATGTTIPTNEQALQVIYAMSDKYELTRRVALMSKDVRTLPVADVFGKFHD